MISKNILYKSVGNIGMLLDIRTPDDAQAPVPCVIYIHGGGWSSGSKDGCNRIIIPLREKILAKGIAFISVGYRHAQHGVCYPKPITDCADAVRYIMLHGEEHGVDSSKILLLGESEGGHLALMCALTGNVFFEQTPDRKTLTMSTLGCVALCPVTCADERAQAKSLATFMGSRLDDEEACCEAFPMYYVQSNAAAKIPALIVHGTDDNVVSCDQSEQFVSEGKSHGYDFELLKSEGAGHMFENVDKAKLASPSWSECCDKIMDFFCDKLGY